MGELIRQCPITLTNSEVKVPWIDSEKDPWYKKYGGFHTGIDIIGRNVYANCPCVCTYIGHTEEDRNVVIIQYDKTTSFRFANLVSVNVSTNAIVEQGQLIGVANRFVHFEYLNRESSQWCVRVGHETYYKHDPYTYVKGEVEFNTYSQRLVGYEIDPNLQLIFDD